MKIARGDALIVVDVQNDFCPGGALPVHAGHEVVPLINRLMPLFRTVVLTQDWHPRDHASFAECHPGRQPFETVEMPYGPQTLWPVHCVQGTAGAAFHPDLETRPARAVIRKGTHVGIDSYSAFFENDRTTPTGLAGFLRELAVERVFLCGLAYDYCVGWSAADAVRLGLAPHVIPDACRSIDLAGSHDAATRSLTEKGVHLVAAERLAG